MGVLNVKFELIPRLSVRLTDDVITEQVKVERSRQAEHERLFLVYAKQWWKEFLQIRVNHKERLVKIFAQVHLKLHITIIIILCLYNYAVL